MQWWLPPSRELDLPEVEALLRRFVEASRRAEITALINLARSSSELAEVVSEELCEACEAEVGFVVGKREGGVRAELIGSIGLTGDEATTVLSAPLCVNALETEGRSLNLGEDLLGVGARSVLLASSAGRHGHQVLVGLARFWQRPFDEAEATLVEAVAPYVGHTIGRFWERDEFLRAQRQLVAALLPLGPAFALWDEAAHR